MKNSLICLELLRQKRRFVYSKKNIIVDGSNRSQKYRQFTLDAAYQVVLMAAPSPLWSQKSTGSIVPDAIESSWVLMQLSPDAIESS